MPSATTVQEQTLTPAELAGLMMHFRASIPESSPLAHIASEPVSPATTRTLKERGLLTPEWDEAVKLLAGAGPAAIVQQASLDSIAESYIFTNPGIESDPRGMLVQRTSGGDYRLRFPMGLPDLLLHVMEPLDPTGSAPPMIFDRKLTAGALTALAATVDHLRILFAASLIERCGLDSFVVTVQDLYDQAIEGLHGSDNRSLVLLLGLLAPEARSSELDTGLAELKSAGLLMDVDNTPGALAPHPELVSLAYNLMSPIPALSLALHRNVAPPGEPPPPRLTAIRGASLWHLEPGANGGDTFRLSCVDGLTSIRDVLNFLARGAGVSSLRCASCQKPLRPNAKVCPWCTTPVRSAQASALVCHACQKPLRPTAKVCPWCTTPVRAAEASQPVCQNCQKPLRPTAKVCPWCTTPVRSAAAAQSDPPSVH